MSEVDTTGSIAGETFVNGAGNCMICGKSHGIVQRVSCLACEVIKLRDLLTQVRAQRDYWIDVAMKLKAEPEGTAGR